MSMRLLPKNELNQAKAAEQKLKIEEGLKIAHRVDVVRQTLLAEEAGLEKFRRETMAKIHEETVRLLQKVEDLKGEVGQLETRRAEALKPLDNEWAALAEAKKQFNVDLQDLNEKSVVVAEREKQAAKAVKQASDALTRAATRDDVSREKLNEANAYHREAKRARKAALTVEAKAKALSEAMEAELTHRDMEAAARERSVTMKEATLNERETELAKGWALLEDRKALFEKRFIKPKP